MGTCIFEQTGKPHACGSIADTCTSMQTTGNYQGLFAGVVIVFIPTVIIYILLSKQIISGTTAGAVKG